MLSPGLDPGDCPNYTTCGSASELTPDEMIELQRVRLERQQQARSEWEAHRERIRVSLQEAAIMMLRMRGCPQSPTGLGLNNRLAAIGEQSRQLEALLEAFASPDVYIAPTGCEAHRYAVARPYAKYWYNKLTAAQAIFQPIEMEQEVRTIHLSHDDDPRNLEARLGIARRNRLLQIQTQLERAQAALERAVELASRPVELDGLDAAEAWESAEQ